MSEEDVGSVFVEDGGNGGLDPETGGGNGGGKGELDPETGGRKGGLVPDTGGGNGRLDRNSSESNAMYLISMSSILFNWVFISCSSVAHVHVHEQVSLRA